MVKNDLPKTYMTRTNPQACQRCGVALDASSLGGACPACLLWEGLGLERESASGPPGGTHQFGDYVLLRKIGQGGMGVVYEALQLRLERTVAVKLLPMGPFSRPDAIQRFKAEASAAAALQHPNIVAIHDVGEHAGQPYYSMELVEGQTLAELVRDHPMPARQAAGYLQAVAAAVQFAHEHGILHRDLKPANILVDPFDHPRITDFGLATRLDAPTEAGTPGERMGSPNFMPPEQAEGRMSEIGPAADIYALGAILYFLVTRQPPFQGESIDTVLRQVRESEPIRPRLLNPSIPRDLETICLRCLQKQPRRRYSSARELAEELGRFLEDRPIRARPLHPFERAWRSCRRQPVRALLAGALIVALALGAGGIFWQWGQARATAQAETKQRRSAQSATYAAQVHVVQGLIEDQQFSMARRILLETPEEFRGWEWGWHQRECHEDLMTLTTADKLLFATFSPDGRKVVAGGFGPKIHQWDAATGQELASWEGHPGGVGYSSFSPSGRYFVSVGWSDSTARILDSQSGRITAVLTNRAGFFLGVFSSDDHWVATAGLDGRIRLWDARTGIFSGRSASLGDAAFAAVFSPDGSRIAFGGGHYQWAGSLDRSIRVWDLTTDQVRTLGSHSELVGGLSWSPDGRTLASCSWSGEIKLWDLASGTELPPLPSPVVHRVVLRVSFSPDGRYLAAAGGGMPNTTGSIDLYDVPARKWVRNYRGHSTSVCDVRFSADGRRLVSASFDGTVKIWPVEPAPPYRTLEGHDQPIWALAYSRDSRQLATGSFDGTAKLWDSASGRMLRSLNIGCPTISLAFGPDGYHLATPGPGDSALVWDLDSGALVQRFTGHQAPVTTVAWANNGRWVATGSRDSCTRIWDPKTGVCVATLAGHAGGIRALQFSADSTRVATAGDDGTVRIWNTDDWGCRQIYTNHGQPVLCLAFRPRHVDVIASGCADGTVRIWDANSGADVTVPLAGHHQPVLALAFSPDGDRIATAANAFHLHNNVARDSLVRLWDVESGHLVLRLLAHDNAVYSVAFSPDGTQLASGGGDHVARIRVAFPWLDSHYDGSPSQPLEDRIERFNRQRPRPETLDPSVPGLPAGRRWVRHLLGAVNLPAAGSKTRPLLPIPARPAAAGSDQVDLATVYNVALDETWQPIASPDDSNLSLRALPPGLRDLGGVKFDVRGIVQLRRLAMDCELFPDLAEIRVERSFLRLHLLHGARGDSPEASEIAALVLHYADGTRAELPVTLGRHLQPSGDTLVSSPDCTEAALVWQGPSGNEPQSRPYRLYRTTFVNPAPGTPVSRIAYVSRMTRCAPFLVALTVDEH